MTCWQCTTQGPQSCESQQQLGHLVDRVRHDAAVDQLLETVSPPETGNPLGRQGMRALPKVRHRSLSGAGATACLLARPTDSFRVIPAVESVGMGRIISGTEEYVALTCPCYNEAVVDKRHASEKQGRKIKGQKTR